MRVTGRETGENTFTDRQGRKNTKIKAVTDSRTASAKRRTFQENRHRINKPEILRSV